MRKTTKLLTTLALCMMFVGASAVATSADTVVKLNKDYKVDLDGKGKKETLRVEKIKGEESDFDYFELIINGRIFKTVTGSSMECKIIDIQKDKKGQEIVYTGSGASQTHGDTFGIYKYKNGKLKKLVGSKFNTYNVIRVPEVSTDGNGKVCMIADTPVDLGNGSYYGELVFKMKNGKLKLVNKNEISIVNDSEEYTYKVNKKIKVYKKASKKSKVVDTLKKKEKIKIKKIKFSDVDNDEWPYEAETAYAYIEDKNGNKGWIKLEDYEWGDDDNQFVNYPAWG